MDAKQAGQREQAAANLPALISYARCMRQHAIAMPDPGPDGQLNLGRVPGISSDAGRHDPRFRAADAACRRLGRREPARLGPGASRPTVAVGTAVVHRQDLAVTDRVDGELGYRRVAPVVNRLAGTYTALPTEGSVVGRGQALYQVDGRPVVLMYGRQPAWRAFAPDISDGPDVAELEANLAAMGFARGLFGTPDAHFDWAAAAERWQHALALAQTGTVELGWVVFLPGAVRVGTHQAAVGAIASPGAQPYTATSSTRVVTVPLDADRQGEARPGAKVPIVLPDGRTTPGTIAEVGRVATAPPGAGAGDPSGRGGPDARPTVTVTVVPDNPAATGRLDQEPIQVELATDTHRGVLAAPITALLALAEGGYGLEVVDPAAGGAIRWAGWRRSNPSG
jgi:hypothetical protein